ncbi:hypothetical protein [Sphingopyxis macrogoltabida]|uniref:Uncharacterized protein n=1 Tax=Sphingopyxis macrogoltabida TaxID=33050 RepID=A0AAC8Z0A9_SPHMC|nr:hypothetical protein [Sphingopyxis macrogoltabida]ALJ13018.1 hypothetical protein LH19_09055 [Sphingopyxis macrogoltabida]AMU89515.1 hypothetical protein ATM17_10785 [Sphingopyxis macrogoltabida]
MAKRTKAKPGDGLATRGEPAVLEVEKRPDENIGRTLARVTLDPQTRNAHLAMSFGSQMFGDRHQPTIAESSAVLAEELQRAVKGDLSLASRIFASQAISLDALFTEMARRSGSNMGHYPDAADRYMRLALKAQAACRATLEALTRLHQPREQTVKHVHVNEGGQAVVADHFHQHRGEGGNGKSDKQSDATGPAGTIVALPSPDPLGNGVPVPGIEGKATLQNARRDESRRTYR